METKRRSIAKAVSYRIFGTITTGIIVWAFTGELKIGLLAGLVDTFVKTLVYFLHERAWAKINYGRVKDIDYQI